MEAGVGDGITTQKDLASQGMTCMKLSWMEMRVLWSKLEVALLFCLILVVWGLFSLPIIFYYLPVTVSENPLN